MYRAWDRGKGVGMTVTSAFEVDPIRSKVKLSGSNPRQKYSSLNPIKIIQIRFGYRSDSEKG